ncbi:MAG: transglycosylase SLT domain-containing protein, partial [Myxococcota bacterium]
YVRFLTRTHKGRGLFTSWLRRSGRYAELVQQTLREWHLPEDLIWVAMIESGFDPTIRSPAGAVGLWQFMRSTGEVYSLEVNRYHDLRKNPVAASQAAAHHLRDLFQRFGSWDLALAAYNMGYLQLLDRIDRYGTTDFSELARQRALPKETAKYVPKIVAAALVANNLDRYGFSDVKVHKPRHFSELGVPGGTPLKTVAKAAGISVKTLRSFNPHLKTNYAPPGPDYLLMVPPGSLSRARAALPTMLGREGASSRDSDVLLPDDLAGLSAVEGGEDWTKDENLLRLLPKPKRRTLRRSRRLQTDELAAELTPRRGDREVVMYRVGPGDTMTGIARQFAIDAEDIARDNRLDPEDRLSSGTMLKLMVKKGVLSRYEPGRRARHSRKTPAVQGGDERRTSRSKRRPGT